MTLCIGCRSVRCTSYHYQLPLPAPLSLQLEYCIECVSTHSYLCADDCLYESCLHLAVQRELHKLWVTIDINGSGKINFFEFTEILFPELRPGAVLYSLAVRSCSYSLAGQSCSYSLAV